MLPSMRPRTDTKKSSTYEPLLRSKRIEGNLEGMLDVAVAPDAFDLQVHAPLLKNIDPKTPLHSIDGPKSERGSWFYFSGFDHMSPLREQLKTHEVVDPFGRGCMTPMPHPPFGAKTKFRPTLGGFQDKNTAGRHSRSLDPSPLDSAPPRAARAL